jgi:endonuclease/exonuclease/phosphatase family metal-dependent hydrolase
VTELDYGGKTLVVYNLHLESRSGGSIQYQQLQETLKNADRYPRDTPVIIAGDLNTKYAHSSREVMQLMRDSGYESAFGDRQQRTHIIVGNLDWIFTRGPIRISNGTVVRDLHGSDHYAVSAVITPSYRLAHK